MKASKFLVLAAGVLGLLAFFLPLMAVEQQGVNVKVSAFQIVKGIDDARDMVSSAKPVAGMDSAEFSAAKGEFDDAASAVKPVVMAVFAPALLLLVIGGVALKRGRFGRLGGAGALVLGLIGLAIWAIINSAANEVDPSAKGIGIHLLMAVGVLGAVGGLLALIKPERAAAAA